MVKFNKFNYLNTSDCYVVNSINDSLNFDTVLNSLALLGTFSIILLIISLPFSGIDEIDPVHIWKILAAILHLGNLDFGDSSSNSNSSN